MINHKENIAHTHKEGELKSVINYSIIIPAHQLNNNLKDALDSVFTSLANENTFEVILVLDGIPANEIFFQQWNFSFFRVESLKENKGPSYARNHGASVANGDILFFIDSDVSIQPDTIQRLKKHFGSYDSPDAIIGSYDDKPDDTSMVSKYRNLLHHYTHQHSSDRVSTFWGACGIIKKDVFWHVGGFNISIAKPCMEDIELGYRLVQNGFTIVLDKKLQVKHLKSWTLANMIETDIFFRARPWTKMLREFDMLHSKELNVSLEERFAAILFLSSTGLLILATIFPSLLFIALTLLTILIVVKRNTYRFFSHHFQWWQLPLIILLHWVYLGCSIIGFVLGTIDSFANKEGKGSLTSSLMD